MKFYEVLFSIKAILGFNLFLVLSHNNPENIKYLRGALLSLGPGRKFS